MAPQYVVYSLEDSIESFFRNYTQATRQECDSFARCLVGPPIEPVPIQGQFSYTVTAGDSENRKIVQFRAGISKLDMDTIRLAKEVHPRIAPTCTEHGTIGTSLSLSVYKMEVMGGITFIEAQDPDRRNTIKSLAEYVEPSRP